MKSVLTKRSANTVSAENVVKIKHIKRMRTIDKVCFRRKSKTKVTNIAKRKVTKTKKNSMKKANAQRSKGNREIKVKTERTTRGNNGCSTTRNIAS